MVLLTTSALCRLDPARTSFPRQRKFRGPRWRPLGRKNYREKLTGLQLVPIMMMLLLSGRSPALPVLRPVTHNPQNTRPKVCSSQSPGPAGIVRVRLIDLPQLGHEGAFGAFPIHDAKMTTLRRTCRDSEHDWQQFGLGGAGGRARTADVCRHEAGLLIRKAERERRLWKIGI